jgi:hypothetical protein
MTFDVRDEQAWNVTKEHIRKVEKWRKDDERRQSKEEVRTH